MPLKTSIPPNCANNRDFDNLLDNPTARTLFSERERGSERAHDALKHLLDPTSARPILHLVPSLIMNPGLRMILLRDDNLPDRDSC
jgi:hypothetical protein